MAFDTAPEFETGRQIAPQITYSTTKDDKEVLHLISKFVQGYVSEPILIFMEDEEDKTLLQAIREACKSAKLTAKECLVESEIRVLSADATQRKDGVYVFPQKFGRGLDFKLMKDARVLILMKADSKLTEADIH